MKRSSYYISSVTPLAVFIVDEDGDRSVTNDAEAVVQELLTKYPDKRIVYRDTMGSWDELQHDGKRFVDFGFLSEEERNRLAQI